MTIKFDLGKFAQNMQKVGSSMLQNGVLLAATRDMNRGGMYGMGGFCGGSIWGFSGGMMGCTPPINIFHPMYSSMTCNPYLTQAGLANAAMCGQQMMENALAQDSQLITQDQNPKVEKQSDFKPEEVKADKSFEEAMDKGGSITFWADNSNETYENALKKLGYSNTKYLDEKHGNKDSELSIDELKAYIKSKNPNSDDATIASYVDKMMKTMDLNGDKKITGDEMTALMAYVDELGSGKKADGTIAFDEFNFATTIMQDKNLSNNMKESIKEKQENLFDK